MKKQEFIKAVKDLATEKGITVNQETVRDLLDVIEEAISNVILADDSVNVMGCKFESVEKAASQGTTKLGGEEKTWTKPAHKAGKVSFLPSKKKSLERM